LSQLAALNDQLVEGLVQVTVLHNDLWIVVGGELSGLAHQLPNKSSAGALGSLDEPIFFMDAQGQALAVQLEKLAAAGGE
jgi:hypothetical protein